MGTGHRRSTGRQRSAAGGCGGTGENARAEERERGGLAPEGTDGR